MSQGWNHSGLGQVRTLNTRQQWKLVAAALPFRTKAEVPYLHQVWRHHTPGPHHVEQRPILVPDDAQHGLAQTEEVEGGAAVQHRLRFTCRQSLYLHL